MNRKPILALLALAAGLTLSAPARAVAATRRGPATQPIPVWTIG